MLHFFISCLLLSPLRRISFSFFFFFNDPAPPDIYPLPLPDALPIYVPRDVAAGAPEDRVRLDVHPHVQVARRSAALTRCALAPEPDPLPVRHARGDAGLARPAAHRAATTRTRRAGVVDDQAPAAALLAPLRER